MKKLLPDSVAGRTLLVLLVGLMISHLASTAIYFTEGQEFAEGHETLRLLGDRRMAERMAVITRVLERTPTAERQSVLEAVNSPSVSVAWGTSSTITDPGEEGGRPDLVGHILGLYLADRREGDIRVAFAEAGPSERDRFIEATRNSELDNQSAALRRHILDTIGSTDMAGTVQASVRLPDSGWLNFSAPLDRPRPVSSQRFVLSMSVMLLAIVVISIWVVHRLVAPLATFARAAERLGTDVNAPQLPETGPREVRQATRAFNEMQDRIRRFVEDRTQMVAAIAHDLATPITRLRLRAEYVEDQEQQRKMLADLEEMEKMIVSTLSFARDDATSEPRQIFDLYSLLHSVCHDVSDAGHSVEFQSEGRLPHDCRPVALRRAFANLVENAVKFGERARVSLDVEPNAVVVRIDDDGQGIPERFQEDVFKPFHRLEASRSRDTGGTGLGLTVARTIIRAHGGDITLSNRAGGGLRVEVVLPR